MAGEANQILLDGNLQKINPNREDISESTSSMEDSSISALSSSSTDLTEDASSSTSSSSSSTLISDTNNGPLYELSELMAQLPVKRGLSKFYQGKSQSHTSLERVKSIEDLAKKVINPYRSKMKSHKSYAGIVLEAKATISKKASRRSSSSHFNKKRLFNE